MNAVIVDGNRDEIYILLFFAVECELDDLVEENFAVSVDFSSTTTVLLKEDL